VSGGLVAAPMMASGQQQPEKPPVNLSRMADVIQDSLEEFNTAD
jgi:hypothetical protein